MARARPICGSAPIRNCTALVKGSAMMHTSLARLRRNLALIIGNAGEPSLAAVLDRPGHGVKNAAHSAGAPVVRDAVAWAQGRLARRRRPRRLTCRFGVTMRA